MFRILNKYAKMTIKIKTNYKYTENRLEGQFLLTRLC